MPKRLIKASSYADDTTLAEALVEFIEEKTIENKAQSTIRNYKQSYEFFTKYLGFDDNTLCKDVDKSCVYKWINNMKNRDVSANSINHYLRDIRTFLYWCMREPREYLPKFEIKEIEKQEEMPKLYSDDDLDLLLAKPLNKKDFVEWRTYAIVSWICGEGNRIQTVLDLRMKDINLAKKKYVLSHSKNKKTKEMPISSAVMNVMKEYIKRFRATADDDEYVFPNTEGNKLTYNGARLAFERYCSNRGIDRASFHSLRHNFAKNFIQQNGNIFKLQEILGHSNIAITRHYVELFGEDLVEGYDDYSLLDRKKKALSRTKKIAASDD